MRRRIISIGRTDVYLHPATVFYAAYVFLSGAGQMVLWGFLSILLHEGAHALAASLLGQPPEEIEITPMGAVMHLESEERLPPVKRMVILASGPLMTVLLAHLAIILTGRGWLVMDTGRALFLSNAAILMINLLPVLPLDGGRLLAMLLGVFLRGETIRRLMRALGTAVGLAIIGASIWLAWRHGAWNWSLAAGGCFVMYSAASATTTQAMAELRRLMDRKSAMEGRGYALIRRVAVMSDEPLTRAVRLLHPGRMTEFVLMERGTMHISGVVTEAEVVGAWIESPGKRCNEICSSAAADAFARRR